MFEHRSNDCWKMTFSNGYAVCCQYQDEADRCEISIWSGRKYITTEIMQTLGIASICPTTDEVAKIISYLITL